MENIFLPTTLDFKKGDSPNEGQLVIEPLYHGYGTTIGNALRRVLLSSLPGAAITSAKIKGVTHEFTTIDGVMEDVLEIVLNLKQVRMKCHSEEPVTLTLKKKGAGIVTAKDFDKNADVEIINQDLHIAEITDKNTEFEMEVTVERGLGFNPTESREDEDREVGVIAIDAKFTPIVNVGYKVEDTRVGKVTNYDKLTLTVETDGTIDPEEAVTQSAKLLIEHFALLAPDAGKES